MTRSSLERRLLLIGLITLVAALMLAALGLPLLFERHLERRAVQEAEVSLAQLIAGTSLGPDRQLQLATPPSDPRFDEAYSGFYWQISLGEGMPLRSRSLWDVSLALPPDPLASNEFHVHTLTGPRQASLLAVERAITLMQGGQPQLVRLVVALDRSDIIRARKDFAIDLVTGLVVLGALIAAAFLVQIRIGLRPLATIKQHLGMVRSGTRPRLPPDYPKEVRPLATEINLLLDERDLALEAARRRAADLAHGLKTPLTALNADIMRLRQAGQTETADQITALSAMMERHIGRELTRARIAGKASLAAPQPLRPMAEQVAAVLVRTPHAEGKAFDFDIAPDCMIRMDRADLEEILGNLMDNAVRYARSVVRIAAMSDGSGTRLCVEDNGPGLDPAHYEQLLERGVRLDESGNAGLGLSIVQDVVDAYGGTLQLGTETLGGLAVIITFPDTKG